MKPDTRAKLETRLRYYEDLGIRAFYRERDVSVAFAGGPRNAPAAPPTLAAATAASGAEHVDRPATPQPPPPLSMPKAKVVIPKAAPSLFAAMNRVEGDTLEIIRANIGPDCQRCKLGRKRKNIVFADGNPNAELVFVGEGPGADEDEQGLPFVGRAGKLLTQMIEAMGLKRSDVYICNVVKCRPPENRLPEKDEIAECSPFLMRQLDVIKPKVIVTLGSCAMQTLLGTTQGITKIHGEWFDWRGTKLMPIYHPAYLLRNPPAKPDAWKDLQKVMAHLGLAMPKKAK